MRWVMLMGFLLAAVAEVLVFIQHPVFGVKVPLVLLVSLLVIHFRFLGYIQILLFAGAASYLVDVVSALQPSTVVIALMTALLAAMMLARRLEFRARTYVPLAVMLNQAVLWLGAGGQINFFGLMAVLAGLMGALAVYGIMFAGTKQLEARL